MALLPEQPELNISEEEKKAVTNLLLKYKQPLLPLTHTTAVMWCPIHDEVMQFHTSKNGCHFTKCEV